MTRARFRAQRPAEATATSNATSRRAYRLGGHPPLAAHGDARLAQLATAPPVMRACPAVRGERTLRSDRVYLVLTPLAESPPRAARARFGWRPTPIATTSAGRVLGARSRTRRARRTRSRRAHGRDRGGGSARLRDRAEESELGLSRAAAPIRVRRKSSRSTSGPRFRPCRSARGRRWAPRDRGGELSAAIGGVLQGVERRDELNEADPPPERGERRACGRSPCSGTCAPILEAVAHASAR